METTKLATPTTRRTLRNCALLLLGTATYVALCALLIVQVSWLVTGLASLALLVVWLILFVRGLGRLGRALGLKVGIWAELANFVTVAVLVPVLFVTLSGLPLFFWWHRAAFEEAAAQAAQGRFALEKRGEHTFVRLPPPYDGLSSCALAWVIDDNGQRYIVFVQSAFAGEFEGYCHIPDKKRPDGYYHPKPVLGSDGSWFHMSVD